MSLAQMGSVGVTTWFHVGSSSSSAIPAPTNATVETSATANANLVRGYYRATS